MPISEEQFKALQAENAELRERLNKIDASRDKRKTTTIKFAKRFTGAFAGKWLRNSFLRLYKEIPENNVKKETLADVSASLLWRLTRIGVLTLFFAILPTIILLFQTNLLLRQNRILSQQNVRLDQQTNLAEANRRGTVTLEMSNIMDQIDAESNRTGIITRATKTRLISHVQALKPYKFLEDDQLIPSALSPERAQLFLYLITSKIRNEDKLEIFKQTKFAYADLKGAYLNFLDVSEAKLPYARIDNADILTSDWDGVAIPYSTINESHIEGSSFLSCDFSNVQSNASAFFQDRFSNTDFNGVSFENTLFSGVQFKSCNWANATLQNVVFSSVKFSGSGDVSKANWENVIVDSEQFLQDLVVQKAKGAETMLEEYKIGKSVDVANQFKNHPELDRFLKMNIGKQYFRLVRK